MKVLFFVVIITNLSIIPEGDVPVYVEQRTIFKCLYNKGENATYIHRHQ